VVAAPLIASSPKHARGLLRFAAARIQSSPGPVAPLEPHMPITLNCSCGKRLQVKDEFAGRRVKCPACGSIAQVPAPEAEPQFEVVEDEEPARPPRKAAAKKSETAGFNFSSGGGDDDDKPRKKGRSKLDEDDEEEEDAPRSRRRRHDDDDEDDEEEDDRPRRRKSRRQPQSNMGARVGYMIGGLVLLLIGVGLAMLGWYGGGRSSTKLLILGVCLAIGGIGTGFKGLTGNVDDDE
jgi:hypothetical protein